MNSLRNYLRKLADSRGKIANKFRKKRFSIFLNLINSHSFNNEKFHILDVGGKIYFWKQMGFVNKENVKITILNLEKEESPYPNIECVVGNGCNMSEYDDNSFDIVSSNSVIEHVGTYQNQQNMAKEIQRVAKSFFLQTPNYRFPFEPHFLTFGFQFLPVKTRAFLLRRFNLGWYSKVNDYNRSIELVKGIRLLRKRELEDLFPGATIIEEKIFGLTKSFMVHKKL